MGYAKPRKEEYKTVVKRSSAGLGLFAGEYIPRDEFVIEYFGPYLTNDEADEKQGKYLFEIDDKTTIDGSGRNNKARYINHSCKPNCEPELDGRRLFIYTTRDIRPGEELTYDYGEEYINDFIKPVGCKCGECMRSKH